MRTKKTGNIVLESNQQTWKKRPSEIRGYQRTYYMNSPDGDYLRVDYNLKEKKVRLYIEVESEGGNAYYAVVTNGKITAERSVSTGRNFGFTEKFHERADIFSTMPNRETLKLVGGNYGIQRGGKNAAAANEQPKSEKEKLLQETKRRYFKKEYYADDAEGGEGGRGVFRRINFFDLLDLLIGILLAGLVFIFFNYSFTAMGATAAFFGIIIGFVDMFFRGRSPIFTKVVFFLVAGAASYIYGYLF
jgi:hypothetical protein